MKMKKKITAMLLGMSLVTAMSVSPAFAAAKTPTFTDNKQMVEYFWNEVFNKHNTAVIDEMTAPNYIQHNPGFQDGRQAFEDGIEGFLKEFPQSKAEIKHIGADGDLVFIHNHITLNDKDRGQAAVDIFRVKDGKIVEHWDVIQDIPEKAENNNTMF
nr:nuclear transport factor 2 family protein [Mitsuokella multacida]